MSAANDASIFSDLFSFESFVQAFSGATGGVSAISAFYPLNTVRTRVQLDESIKPGSVPNVAKQIVDKYGFQALFQGWWSAVVCLGVSNFTYFYCYSLFKMLYCLRVLGSKKAPLGVAANLVLASAAGVVNVLSTTPLWVVNARLSVQDPKNPKYSGVYNCLTTMASEEGVEKLWSGVGSGLMLVSNPTIHFVAYENIKPVVEKLANKLGFGIVFIGFWSGALAKLIATVVTYPIQTAQAKLRNDKKNEYKGTGDCLQQLYNKGGFELWFRGMESKIVQTVLTAAFQFTTYEALNAFIINLLLGDKAKNLPVKSGH